MAEERITETTDKAGDIHSTNTVITDQGEAKSGRFSSGLLVLLAALAIGAVVIFSQMSNSDVVKHEAIANAADQVGDAAQKHWRSGRRSCELRTEKLSGIATLPSEAASLFSFRGCKIYRHFTIPS